jgi:hypothetical protein
MKNYINFKSIFAVLVVMVSIAAFSGLAAVFAGGLTLAAIGGAVAGDTPTTTNIKAVSTNLLRPEISQKVTQMQPSRTPLNTIVSMIAPVKSKSFEHKFYAVENRPFTDTVNGAYTKVGDGSETATIVVDNISMWGKGDTIKVNGSTGTDGQEVCLYVYDKDIDLNAIKVQAYNNTGTGTMATKQVVPSIADAVVFTRMAKGMNEEDAQTESHVMLPGETIQYNQIFMAQIEQGMYAEEHNKEVDFGFADYGKQIIYDFKATQELTMLFNAKAKITDKLTGKEKYLTGGLARSIANDLEYGAGSSDRTITHDNLVDWHKSNFAGNAGSNSKVVFGGSGFTASLLKLKTVQDTTTDVTIDYVVKRQDAGSTEVKYGVEFKQIKTNFGTWFYYYHPLFDEAGWADKALVLDLAHIEKAVWKPMEKRPIDLLGSGQKKAKAYVIEETCSLVLRYPDVHAIIAPK